MFREVFDSNYTTRKENIQENFGSDNLQFPNIEYSDQIYPNLKIPLEIFRMN
jgi:hypothetical protein